ncbi:hypothetical protein [Streptomyces niphimycinicus]|nr:hypothetical protein [Streptomyces niphimycinicus]
MDIPDRLIELQQAADNERDKLTGLDGQEAVPRSKAEQAGGG